MATSDVSYLAFVEQSMRPQRARMWVRCVLHRAVERRWTTVSLMAFAFGAPYVTHLVETEKI
jgi:hypothetical protein